MLDCKFYKDGKCESEFNMFANCYNQTGCAYQKPKTEQKTDCLKEADTIINGERQDAYGAPENSFGLIAQYWSAYLDQMESGPLDSVDVGNLLILFKMARCSGQKPSRDTYVDIAGYAAIVADRLMEGEKCVK